MAPPSPPPPSSDRSTTTRTAAATASASATAAAASPSLLSSSSSPSLLSTPSPPSPSSPDPSASASFSPTPDHGPHDDSFPNTSTQHRQQQQQQHSHVIRPPPPPPQQQQQQQQQHFNRPRIPLPQASPNSSAWSEISAPSTPSSTFPSLRVDPLPDGAAASSSAAGRHPEDIEMDPIAPAGHRRRRSTLTSALAHQAANSNSPSTAAPSSAGTHLSAHAPIGHRRSVSGQHHGPQRSASGASRPRSHSVKVPPAGEEPKISEESAADGIAYKSEGRDSFSDEDLQDDEEMGLTSKDRRRKQKKRRRNTRLDQRVAQEHITDEERKEADQNVMKRLTVNASLIGLWYLFSLSISLYNKWMFDSSRLNFPFPLFTTSMHMLVQFILAVTVLYFFPTFRPHHAPHESDLGRSRHESEPERPPMTKMFYFTRIGPCGAATGLDIGLGNMSLKFITLTFYTMCKSSSLAFVLLFAFVFRLETPTWRLVAIIALMTFGVVMMVAGEIEFKLGGFVLVISAALFSGFRWSLTQILLLRNPATSNPFSSIFFLAPIMFVTLMMIAIPVEGFGPLFQAFRQLSEEWGSVRAPLILLFPGTLAFLMTASEFALLKRSSVVTLSIAGIFKEVVTITVAALVFDDKLTPINISGLVVTIGAIGAYNYIKLSKMREEARMDAHNKGGYQPAQSSGESTDHGSDEDEEETGLLAHTDDERSASEGNLVTMDGDIIPKPTSSASGDESRQHRTEHRRGE